MIVTFDDKDLEQLVFTQSNKKYRQYQRDARFMRGLRRAYTAMCAASGTDALRQASFLHYEQLRNSGLSSVRPCNGYPERILFREYDGGIAITILELNTTHYSGKK